MNEEIIPFTKKHEKLLFDLNSKVEVNTQGIERNAQGIERNAQGIERNARGIEANGEGIRRNGVLLETLETKFETFLEIGNYFKNMSAKAEMHEKKLRRHDDRIAALESVVKHD